MFGFIAAPCPRCSSDAYPAWRGTFRGLARCLGREFGDPARRLVNRDAAFMGLPGMSLDPQAPRWKEGTCCNPFARPFAMADGLPAVVHAAAVSVCGLAAKPGDDSRDEGFFRRGMDCWDAASDCGPGDKGCCDCNPRDGCDGCP